MGQELRQGLHFDHPHLPRVEGHSGKQFLDSLSVNSRGYRTCGQPVQECACYWTKRTAALDRFNILMIYNDGADISQTDTACLS